MERTPKNVIPGYITMSLQKATIFYLDTLLYISTKYDLYFNCMKKILLSLCLIALLCSCNKVDFSSVTIKDGMDKEVKINAASAFFGFEKFVNEQTDKEGFTKFLQHQFDKLKIDCKNELTFVPMSIMGFDTTGKVVVDFKGTQYTLYEYNCRVEGMAKNGFGVEQKVSKLIGLPKGVSNESGYWVRTFVMKDNWTEMHPRYRVFNAEDYKIFFEEDSLFKSLYDVVPFEYKGETLYFGYAHLQLTTK